MSELLATGACPFCAPDPRVVIAETDTVLAIWDLYPVSPGHALIIPKRHYADWSDGTLAEHGQAIELIRTVRGIIEAQHAPQGYNIGWNAGVAAGQTILHAHLHVIPRYVGDARDPRGGIRGVIPGRAIYEVSRQAYAAPHAEPLIRGASDPLLPHLVAHLDRAIRVDIAVAFVMESGVKLLVEHLRDVVGRGGQVRFLTGDYLDVTDPKALRRLADVGEGVDLCVFESAGTSFHPKSYICIEEDGEGTAFVGSSNLSRSALETGVEWNYRVITSRDPGGFAAVCSGYDQLLTDVRIVKATPAWIDQYEARRSLKLAAGVLPGITGLPMEPPLPIPQPHEIQRQALFALTETRATGNEAGLVVLATGLGKTWLAAFDTAQANAKRVLFVAHRDEILDQALRTFRAVRPTATLGKYTGTERQRDADVVFASVQTLGRVTHLRQFEPEEFDYIVVDEFHHAAAATYRRLIDHFRPRFLLGLTATPERTDGADLLAYCGENLVYRCDLSAGIRQQLLSPFDYFGVPDEVDYSQIPWRSNRFDEQALTIHVATISRADNALDQLRRRGGKKTVAFCVSQRHADFMREHFTGAGLRTASVHSGPGSDPRARSLELLQAGELDVLFAVDMFNEGIDLPDVDTILMLRPTESSVLWLQQFGRGLRWRPEKRLKVIDYIGNHRTFLLKPKTLFQIDGGDAQLSYALKLLEEGNTEALLPPGCSVTYDLKAIDILRSLIRPAADGVESFYREFRERHGMRPTATETFHAYFDPKSVIRGYGSWFQFVRAMGDLPDDQGKAEVRLRDFLTALEITPMTKSYKMVVLLAMLAENSFPGRIEIRPLVGRVRALARRTAILREEFGTALEDDTALRVLLEENPIRAWTEGRGTRGTGFFEYSDGTFTSTLQIDSALNESAAFLTRELAEWRLAVYLRRTSSQSGADRIVCKVSHANGRPILFLPSRDRVAGLPEGWVDVTADGGTYQAKFATIAVNVLQRVDGDESNLLPELMQRWFGQAAGQPGTTQLVEFSLSGGGYVMAPLQGEVPSGPRLWASYVRAEVPKVFGFEFSGFESQSGIVEREKLILLFVTLDKSSKPEEHRYEDAFVSPTEFRWQSQNRMRRDSKAGARIREHAKREIGVHLFVRPTSKVRSVTQPFTYFGQLRFDRWEGDNPFTVWWQMEEPVPERLWGAYRISNSPIS